MITSSTKYACLVLILCTALTIQYAVADRYVVPPSDLDIVGALQSARIQDNETVIELTRRLGFGQDEVRIANSTLDRWLPVQGEQVILPSRYVLPDVPRSGIVVNLPEMRLYYFHRDLTEQTTIVDTFPVSIGREHWATPMGNARVVNMKENPDWYPPASIKSEAAERGHTLPDKVLAGPNNPLGQHAIYLNLPGYLLHGTNAPNGIGMRVTHGCIRLYPEDIKQLYQMVEIGTPVTLVDQPVKVGWHTGVLYLEVHPPVVEPKISNDELLELAVALINIKNTDPVYQWRTSQVRRIVISQTGIPAPIHNISAAKPPHAKQP